MLRSIIFTRSEMRGIVVLLLLLAVVLVIRFTFIRSDVPELEFSKNQESHFKPDRIDQYSQYVRKGLTEYDQGFDPNKAGKKDLIGYGFSDAVADEMIRMRHQGLIFKSPADMFRIQGFDSALYLKIKRHIYFDPAVIYYYNQKFLTRNNKSMSTIKINNADSADLLKLPGIGPVLSSRIIRYRNLLGGFYASSQIGEVYGVNDSLLAVLERYIEIDTVRLQKINLNTSNFYDLEKHPYINSYQAKAILSYRKLIGPFDSKQDLLNNYILPEENYFKLQPYLAIK